MLLRSSPPRRLPGRTPPGSRRRGRTPCRPETRGKPRAGARPGRSSGCGRG
jgi:hypothetical protein